MEDQIKSLQKQVHQLRVILFVIISLFLLAALVSFTTGKSEIIRTKGIIIEDNQGKPFIIMGNPLPQDKLRKRKDPLGGLVFLDDKGTDRLFIGKDGKLQMGGELVDRNSEGWSYIINDTVGDERGGFGFSDEEDRIGLGLDYGGKDGLEAIYLNASQEGAYILVNANVAKGVRDRIVLWHDTPNDLTQIKVGDKLSDDRILLRATGGKPSLVHKKNGVRKDITE
ncbi:hypothetical protein AAEO56_00060 [Flavobacterium sp. DGU11]|uniref:Uncharacterized protein n=1 Tax=Flavobacterium arundinis TaxID=3139143 RepID=A0ABU9HRU1_9FLAO